MWPSMVQHRSYSAAGHCSRPGCREEGTTHQAKGCDLLRRFCIVIPVRVLHMGFKRKLVTVKCLKQKMLKAGRLSETTPSDRLPYSILGEIASGQTMDTPVIQSALHLVSPCPN